MVAGATMVPVAGKDKSILTPLIAVMVVPGWIPVPPTICPTCNNGLATGKIITELLGETPEKLIAS